MARKRHSPPVSSAAHEESPARDPASAVRARYEEHGAETYYRRFGDGYRNPHEPIVRRLLDHVVPAWGLDLSAVLDLAAGSGEATLGLRALGAGHIHGIDPYTYAAYEARTGGAAERLTFEQIAAAGLGGRRYSLIVCSFALHLCAPSRLPRLAYQLRLASDALLVLTPHKRPVLREAWGWGIAREVVVERVGARLYRAAPDQTDGASSAPFSDKTLGESPDTADPI